ncbi:MAG: hypothetical protein ACRDJE_09335, partial [Dehalococcoidia bacterium]
TPDALLRRRDLTVRGSRTAWAARRPWVDPALDHRRSTTTHQAEELMPSAFTRKEVLASQQPTFPGPARPQDRLDEGGSP